ncbi:hypothetical protein C8R42DRAFT_648499 [Lentinula raphanica]|nr:hypothetical protein C8R42DRAFT_648499 [Lentinula raphanica]
MAPMDKVLLLAVLKGEWEEVPEDVWAWFGGAFAFGGGIENEEESVVELSAPDEKMRERFFETLFEDIQQLPNKFLLLSSSKSQNSNPNPYAYKRPKRTLPSLPLAPPSPPPPVDVDMNVIVVKEPPHLPQHPQPPAVMVNTLINPCFFSILILVIILLNLVSSLVGKPHLTQSRIQAENPTPIPNPNPNFNPLPNKHQFYNINLKKIHEWLYRSYYLTSFEFLANIWKIMRNAELVVSGLHVREMTRMGMTATATANKWWYKAQAMLTMAKVSMGNVVDPFLREECEHVRGRERERRRVKMKRKRKREKERERERRGRGRGRKQYCSSFYPSSSSSSSKWNGYAPKSTTYPSHFPVQLSSRQSG